jgi:carboxymethylenebutenolidase
MRNRILALGLVVFALAALASAGTMVTYPSGSETVSSYLATPAGAGNKPAIVVIHEWWGLNDWIKSKADAFAKEGYVALAVDLYRGKVATDPDMAHQLMRGVPDDRAVRDMKAAVAYLKARPDVDGSKIASIGWCWGGGMSLDLAVAEPTLAGGVIYYGHLMTDPKTIAALKVPLLGNFGADDQGIPPDTVREFEALAKKDGKNVDFKIYPGAGHGFASGNNPKNPQAAMDADARTEAFLKKVLKGAA